MDWGKGLGCELREVRTPWASVDYCNDVDFLWVRWHVSRSLGQRGVMSFDEVNVESNVGEINVTLIQYQQGTTGLWRLPLLSHFL